MRKITVFYKKKRKKHAKNGMCVLVSIFAPLGWPMHPNIKTVWSTHVDPFFLDWLRKIVIETCGKLQVLSFVPQGETNRFQINAHLSQTSFKSGLTP